MDGVGCDYLSWTETSILDVNSNHSVYWSKYKIHFLLTNTHEYSITIIETLTDSLLTLLPDTSSIIHHIVSMSLLFALIYIEGILHSKNSQTINQVLKASLPCNLTPSDVLLFFGACSMAYIGFVIFIRKHHGARLQACSDFTLLPLPRASYIPLAYWHILVWVLAVLLASCGGVFRKGGNS